jgi:hypothetical protein
MRRLAWAWKRGVSSHASFSRNGLKADHSETPHQPLVDSSTRLLSGLVPQAGSTMNTMDDNGDVLYNLACSCEMLFEQCATLSAQTTSVADLVAEYQQRFAIWAGYLGVFASKSQSLDTRLRNHVDIQDLVARLLDILQRSLGQCE